MSINLTLLVQLLVISVVVPTIISALLAKRFGRSVAGWSFLSFALGWTMLGSWIAVICLVFAGRKDVNA
ncbi:hypothetical protein [Salinibius halmophilus]|uniref:hypothetical protein n=1 Tax=Salinibius halmophilus TaxID=1853216 RepID=UPI000E66662B|nr:hypothetical protein [Salinibius halmophilus]